MLLDQENWGIYSFERPCWELYKQMVLPTASLYRKVGKEDLAAVTQLMSKAVRMQVTACPVGSLYTFNSSVLERKAHG